MKSDLEYILNYLNFKEYYYTITDYASCVIAELYSDSRSNYMYMYRDKKYINLNINMSSTPIYTELQTKKPLYKLLVLCIK